MNRLLIVLPLVIIAASWWARRSRPRPRGTLSAAPSSPDERTLAALANAGADLSKPTEVNFYLYMPTEGHARSAADVARREGYAAEVRPPLEGYSKWLCLLSRVMVPQGSDIAQAGARLDELAESLGGEFDGWEAAVTPR